MAGKLIVIDGTDGSGKHTQVHLLVKYLKNKRKKVKTLGFPQYDSLFGKLIAKYLHGDYGSPTKVPVEFASLIYALDRFDAKNQIVKWLAQGNTVILDRYVQSNLAYQCAKVKSLKEKHELQNWLFTLEYEKLKVPMPTKVIILYVPQKVSQKLLQTRPKKPYLKGKTTDEHEKNKKYMLAVEKEYVRLAKELKWTRINCTKDDTIMSRKQIHERIVRVLHV